MLIFILFILQILMQQYWSHQIRMMAKVFWRSYMQRNKCFKFGQIFIAEKY